MLTKEQLEAIDYQLMKLYNITDNQLYAKFSVQGLKDELESIEDLRSKIQEQISELEN